MSNKRSVDFWNEIKKIKGTHKAMLGMVDGAQTEEKISQIFSRKYDRLYNSVSYDATDMSLLQDDISKSVSSHLHDSGPDCICKRGVSVNLVEQAMAKIKFGKTDANNGCSSNHFKNGTNKLNVYFSLLFTAMWTHNYVPCSMLTSTIIPIPKNRRKSLNDIDNYRAIALSSILGKLLDWVILLSCDKALSSNDSQFGFKPKHSTSQCTFVIKEPVQYYLNGGSIVYGMLLDASKAFDRIQFIKLFRLLLSRGLCPVICRLIATLYTNQTSRVKWGSSFSETFSISNGVKQGGVLSPILFGVYINSLLDKLEHSRAGCYIGHIFMGAFGYADDIILLAPCKKSLCVLLDICKQFSLEFQVNFNSSKSKLIVFSNANDCDTSVLFNNQMISSVSSEQHLGHIIGNQVSQECIKNITNDFIKRVNVLSAVFKFTFSETKYFLFKVFCMSLYGSVLWDFSSKHVEMFYTTWRKCIRRLLGLPYRAHNNLLHLICNDIPVDGQLHLRF